GQVHKEDLVEPPLAQQLWRQARHVVGRDEQEALAAPFPASRSGSSPAGKRWSCRPLRPGLHRPTTSIYSIINGPGAMRLACRDSVCNLSKVHSQYAQRLTRAEAKQNGLFLIPPRSGRASICAKSTRSRSITTARTT